MKKLIFLISISNVIHSQDITFQDIKGWSDSDVFAENIFDNFWSTNESSKFYVKATHSVLGEIYYYKEDTPENVINTFEVNLLSKDLMMNIRNLYLKIMKKQKYQVQV